MNAVHGVRWKSGRSGVDGIRAGEPEDRDGQIARRESREPGEERDARLVGPGVAARVRQPRGLRRRGADHGRMAMADERDAESSGEIDEHVSVDVPDVRAVAPEESLHM